MTDDYKEKLLRYLTGKFNIVNYTGVTTFREPQTSDSDLYVYMVNNIGSTGELTVVDILTAKNSSGENIDYSIIYGSSTNTTIHSSTFGFILIVDRNMQPVQLFTEYDSGTVIGQIYKMSVDEEGRYFMIENAYGENRKRLVLLNNITVKTSIQDSYTCELRKAYNLSGKITNCTEFNYIQKKTDESIYGIVGSIEDDDSTYKVPSVAFLKVESGSSNVWTQYNYPNTNINFDISDVYLTWDDESDPHFILVGFENTSGYGYCVWSVPNNTTLSEGRSLSEMDNEIHDIKITDERWVVGMTIKDNPYTATKHYNALFIWSGQISLDDGSGIGGSGGYYNDYENTEWIKATRIGGSVYLGFATSTSDSTINNLYLAHYEPTVLENQLLVSNSSQISSSYLFNILKINKIFNLINYNYVINDNNIKMQETYRDNGYNFINYDYYGALNQTYGVIEDNETNKSILFARDLYNKRITDNLTISTLEIPNTFLNDVDIYNKELYGLTNGQINIESSSLTKNIYEKVYLNFYNTISIQNQNDLTNIIENLTGAVRLNEATSTDTASSSTSQMNDVMITKYIINYGGTAEKSSIFTFDLDSQVEFIGNNQVMYDFNVYVPNTEEIEGIRSISLLSNDEMTVYQTISLVDDDSNEILEKGKIYSITQMVEIN